MSNITYVQNKSDIPLEKDWIDKSSFPKKGKIVTQNGKEYTIETKKCVKYSGGERFGRIILGMIACLFSLGVSLASKRVRQLFYKDDKASKIFAVLNKIEPPSNQNDDPNPNNGPNPNGESKIHQPGSDQIPIKNEGSKPEVILNDLGSDLMPKESESALRFYSEADQMSFWDSYLEVHTQAISDEKWNKLPGMFFLNEELLGIKCSLEELCANVQKTLDEFVQKKIDSENQDPNFLSPIRDIHDLKKRVEALISKAEQSLLELNKNFEKKLNTPDLPPRVTLKVQGIKNPGNTCYINSAMQPLLAVRDFTTLVPDLVPSEPAHSVLQRQSILDSFKTFLMAREAQLPAGELGQYIAELRRNIFEAGLQQGGFVNQEDEREYQDAGQFFELILHVINGGFELEMTRIPVMDDGTLLDLRRRVEKTPEGVFYLKAPGNSIQEMVNGHRKPLAERFTAGNEWKVNIPVTNEDVKLANYTELNKIVGPTPEILVMRVNNWVVQPEEDHNVNLEALFRDVSPDGGYDYELAGFSQNIGQYHWTSVVWDGRQWQYCDDDRVKVVDPNDDSFQRPANYMVYKKITRS